MCISAERLEILAKKSSTLTDGLLKCPVRVGAACWTCNPGPVVQYSLGVFVTVFFLLSRSKASDANIDIIANFV